MLNAVSRGLWGRALIISLAFGLSACGGEPSGDADPSTGSGETVAKDAGVGALADMTMGAGDAPVTVIEYASVTCPHCATFHETVFPELKEKYVDTGKVRFVFREFPTAPAELSVAGSMLARCAADKGGEQAYFLVLGSLFKTQQNWIYGDTRDELMKIAQQAGLDEAGFNDCVGRQELIDLINANVADGRDKYGVMSTPSFVVDGVLRRFTNADSLSNAIDEALAKAEAE